MHLPSLLELAALGCLALLPACAIQARPQAGAVPPTFGPRSPGDPSTLPYSGPLSGSAGPERVCRNEIPRDWVAVDFMVGEDCPANEKERFTGALVVRLRDYPRGAELLVCADQRMPRGWRRLGSAGEVSLPDQCPSSGDSRPVTERVIRILKS